jgi:hypothetical protein
VYDARTVSDPKPRPPALLGVFLAGLALALLCQPLTGGDQYWHLSIGRWIREHGAIPFQDPFSFSAHGAPFTPHAVLFDLGLEALSRLGGGLAGLRLARALLPVAFGLSLYYGLLRRRLRGRYRPGAYLAILATGASLDLAIPRPYWVPLILLPWLWRWIDLTLEEPEGQEPGLGWYFLGAYVWAWSHGSMILALVAPGTALVFDGITVGRRKSLRLVGACVAALVASVTTAHGLGLWRYLYTVSTNRYHERSGFVNEWMPPELFGPTWEANLVLAVFVVIVAVGWRRGRRWQWVWTAVWTWGYLRFVRQLGLMLMAWAVLAAEALDQRLEEDCDPEPPDGPVLGVALAALVALVALAPGRLPGPHVKPSVIPVKALDEFLATTDRRRLFHRFHWGGYIVWRSEGRVPCFFDGRVHVFGETIHTDYQKILLARSGWEEAFDGYRFDAVLLARNAPLWEALDARGGWVDRPFGDPGYRLVVPAESAP